MLEQELSQMDRITQLQDGIESLLDIMSTNISTLVTKTNFQQVSMNIPITKTGSKALTKIEFEKLQADCVAELIKKAKEVELLIASLPGSIAEEKQVDKLRELEDEMQVANAEYRDAVARAKNLHAEISDLLRTLLRDGEQST